MSYPTSGPHRHSAMFQIPDSRLTSQLLWMDKSEMYHRTLTFRGSPSLILKLVTHGPNLKSTDLLFLITMNYFYFGQCIKHYLPYYKSGGAKTQLLCSSWYIFHFHYKMKYIYVISATLYRQSLSFISGVETAQRNWRQKMQLQDLKQLARPLKQRRRSPLTNWTDSGWAEDNRMELYNLELI